RRASLKPEAERHGPRCGPAPDTDPQEEASPARRTGPIANPAPRGATGVLHAERVDWHRILPVCALLRDGWALCMGRAPVGGRGLAADRLADESEGASGQRADAAPAPCRDVDVDRLSGGLLDLPQELLRLAVSRGDGFGVSVAAGTPDVRTQLPPAAQAGRGAAQPQVSAARIVPV